MKTVIFVKSQTYEMDKLQHIASQKRQHLDNCSQTSRIQAEIRSKFSLVRKNAAPQQRQWGGRHTASDLGGHMLHGKAIDASPGLFAALLLAENFMAIGNIEFLLDVAVAEMVLSVSDEPAVGEICGQTVKAVDVFADTMGNQLDSDGLHVRVVPDQIADFCRAARRVKKTLFNFGCHRQYS